MTSTEYMYLRCRKLRSELADAQQVADHHKLLAHTVSKSYALAIIENEQLHQASRLAQHSIHRAQQQSKHHQEEAERLQKKLDQALHLTAIAEAAGVQQSKLDGGSDFAAAADCKACEAEQAHQTGSTCQQDPPHKLQRDADQAEPHSCAASRHVPHENEGTQDQNAIGLTDVQDHSKTVQLDSTLQHKIASLEHELTAVKAQLMAAQQTLQATQQQQQDYQHAFRFALRKLQQSEASLNIVVKLHENLKSAILRPRQGLPQLASRACQQAKRNSTTADVDHQLKLKALRDKVLQDSDSNQRIKKHKSSAIPTT